MGLSVLVLTEPLVHRGRALAGLPGTTQEHVVTDCGYVLSPGEELPAGSRVLVGDVLHDGGGVEPLVVVGSSVAPRLACSEGDWFSERVGLIDSERLIEWFRDHGWTEVADGQWRLLGRDGRCETWIVGSTELSVETVKALAGLAGCSFTSCLESLAGQSPGSSE